MPNTYYSLVKNEREPFFFTSDSRVSGSYLFSIGILLAVLKSFGIVDTTFITKHGIELGTVFYLLLCAVSLNDRYTVQKVIKKEEEE